jgi:hypothetical protein
MAQYSGGPPTTPTILVWCRPQVLSKYDGLGNDAVVRLVRTLAGSKASNGIRMLRMQHMGVTVAGLQEMVIARPRRGRGRATLAHRPHPLRPARIYQRCSVPGSEGGGVKTRDHPHTGADPRRPGRLPGAYLRRGAVVHLVCGPRAVARLSRAMSGP